MDELALDGISGRGAGGLSLARLDGMLGSDRRPTVTEALATLSRDARA
ncbi:MAG TPA: hypothetical protein VLF66_10315 [Thermoanaerobaculia bacterium]|nr:hypothetical protein [Thermoanaerobaculia bacterium]